jgi:uncharacterized protein YbdZ (MbtH family)
VPLARAPAGAEERKSCRRYTQPPPRGWGCRHQQQHTAECSSTIYQATSANSSKFYQVAAHVSQHVGICLVPKHCHTPCGLHATTSSESEKTCTKATSPLVVFVRPNTHTEKARTRFSGARVSAHVSAHECPLTCPPTSVRSRVRPHVRSHLRSRLRSRFRSHCLGRSKARKVG